jgi:lipid A 3-O-deacylase
MKMREKLALACMFTFIGSLYNFTIPNILYAAGVVNQGSSTIQTENFNKHNFKYKLGQKKVAKAPNEIEIEYLHPMNFKDRHMDTYSTHIFESVGNINHTDLYRGFTVTRVLGSITNDNGERNSDALGIGYTYLLRKKENISKKVVLAFDVSGGLVLYDQAFPATGRAYNFMWRVGPRVIYMPTTRTSFSLGWTYMHVSNGMQSHNPGYNSGGITLGLGWDF